MANTVPGLCRVLFVAKGQLKQNWPMCSASTGMRESAEVKPADMFRAASIAVKKEHFLIEKGYIVPDFPKPG